MPLSEKSLIARVRRMADSGRSSGQSAIVAGIGDDCAVLRFSRAHGQSFDALVTTDFSLEGVHFRRDWHSPESIGHRCLARGLSDIAAMGGEPVAAFLSLAVPRDLPQVWIDRFFRGLIALGKRHGVTLSGGDTAQSPNRILADIIVIGKVPRREAVLRSGARPGDCVYVSGNLGGSAAAAQEMMKKPKRKLSPKYYPRHFFPDPQIELGQILRRRKLASAMIDTSDGLSTDLAHICEESGVGAEIDAESIPLASIGKLPRDVDLELALHGGEDYELLFTAPPNKTIPSRLAGVPITLIGHVTRKKKLFLNRDGVGQQLEPQGWEHFRR